MNKSVMKCCICNNKNIGQFITINNKKYHLCCIEQLQQENEQLKIQISAREEEYKKLEDNWNELKEYIDIKLYNMEYLQKLCGCRLDDEIHIILDIIKKEMKELEGSDSNE